MVRSPLDLDMRHDFLGKQAHRPLRIVHRNGVKIHLQGRNFEFAYHVDIGGDGIANRRWIADPGRALGHLRLNRFLLQAGNEFVVPRIIGRVGTVQPVASAIHQALEVLPLVPVMAITSSAPLGSWQKALAMAPAWPLRPGTASTRGSSRYG